MELILNLRAILLKIAKEQTKLKQNKPGGKIEYMSKKNPPTIAANQAKEEKPARNKTTTRTKTKDNCLGNNGRDVCKTTRKKINKNKIINLPNLTKESIKLKKINLQAIKSKQCANPVQLKA